MRNLSSLGAVCLLFVVLPSQAALNIFACEPEWASLSEEIGGDKVAVYSATTAKQDVHRIQARPSLIAKMRRADLVVCTGAELEAGWLPVLLQRASNRKVQPSRQGYFMAAEKVERLDIPEVLDRSMGDVHAGGNPHIHLDPHRIQKIAQLLAERLIEIDTANEEFYRARLSDFEQRWQAAIERWQKQAEPLKSLGVVAHHKDWRYLLDWLGMEEVATLEPKPGLPPSASHLATLKTKMATQRAAMILRTAYQKARPSEWLSDKTGIPAVQLPYTVGGSQSAEDLFGLFDETLTLMLKTTQK